MADPIERVARAIYPHIVYGTDFSEVPVDEAFSRARYSFLPPLCRKAAAEALGAMRDPTPEMALAGARSIGKTMDRENHIQRSVPCWQEMVDCALKATSKEPG